MKESYVLFTVTVVALITGFYFITQEMGDIKDGVHNIELSLELMRQQTASAPTSTGISTLSPQEGNFSAPQGAVPESSSISIPTSIIFYATSSLLLAPQVKLTITVDSVSKDTDGLLTVKLKVFTNEASSYTALEPRDLFEVVLLDSDNLKAIKTFGQFSSMPPKTSISGTLIFKMAPDQSKVILQAKQGTNFVFYEFDLIKKTYKEVTIG